jgi:hypothetical protein
MSAICWVHGWRSIRSAGRMAIPLDVNLPRSRQAGFWRWLPRTVAPRIDPACARLRMLTGTRAPIEPEMAIEEIIVPTGSSSNENATCGQRM